VVRSFGEALVQAPLLFEAAPPSQRTSVSRQTSYYDDLVGRLRQVPGVDAFDVPELVDENHEGKPYYRSGDPRPFARRLSEALGRPSIVNKVVAHLPSTEALRDWMRETVELGVRHVVLVGGSSRYIPYPGPPVVEANRICASILKPHGGYVGNITIPQRTGEAHRMLAKTRAGASFFTTQIVMDSEALRRMLTEYDTLCKTAGVSPAAVLLSVVSIADETDAEFVRWLGADVPEAAERTILDGEESGAAARSAELAQRVYREVRQTVKQHELSVPIGINVEQISQRHLAPAVEMLRSFSALLMAE
jgi:5,10-methylenetetrahydrofolate reductase